MFCVCTDLTKWLIVCFKSGFGHLEVTHNPAFSGGCLVVHWLWKARFVGWFIILWKSLF